MSNPFELIDKRLSNIETLLLDIKHPPSTSQPVTSEHSDLITRDEALKFLHVTAATIWRWEKQGKIQSYGMGGKRYFRKSELEASLIAKK